jgi:hypothetical protein
MAVVRIPPRQSSPWLTHPQPQYQFKDRPFLLLNCHSHPHSTFTLALKMNILSDNSWHSCSSSLSQIISYGFRGTWLENLGIVERLAPESQVLSKHSSSEKSQVLPGPGRHHRLRGKETSNVIQYWMPMTEYQVPICVSQKLLGARGREERQVGARLESGS